MILLQRLALQNWRIGTKLIVLIVPLVTLITVIAAWTLHHRNTTKLNDRLIQRARSLHTQIMADREYYASVIVPRIIELGGSLGPNYHRVNGQFPLPATFLREVSDVTNSKNEGYSANLISPWPINREKGLKDEFQQDAFAYLTKYPIGQFFRTDRVEGRAVMRVLMADHASAQSCVDCHNAHAQSPRRDFKLNDLMGGLEITMPMDRYIKENQRDLVLTVGGGATLCLLVVGTVVMGTRQIVTRPLARLASRMRVYAHQWGSSSLVVSASHGDEVAYLAAAYQKMQDVIATQQEELKEANTRLQAQVVELKAVNDELEAFSYSVSHDLRAPLRAMDGFSRILLDEHASQVSDEVRNCLQEVRQNTQQMDILVNALLRFSRLGRQRLAKETVAPADLVRQVLGDLHSEQDGRRVEITIGDLPVCHADPVLLKQVFVNLLSNALKFTRQCEVARIMIGCQVDDGRRAYFVKDNGVGFEMQYAHKLFGVFQRLHRAEDFQGTGIGLAMVQRIIHRHGGRVWAESEVNKGATFHFTLTEELSHG